MELDQSSTGALEQAFNRLAAKIGERRAAFVGYWAGGWFCWQLEGLLDWLGKGRSPLIWQSTAGLLEWLAWTAVATALMIGAYAQMFRDLEGKTLHDDLGALGKQFLRALGCLAVIYAIGGLRYWLRGKPSFTLPPDFSSRIAAHPLQAIVLGLMLIGLTTLFPVIVFIFRLCGVLLKHGFQRG